MDTRWNYNLFNHVEFIKKEGKIVNFYIVSSSNKCNTGNIPLRGVV